MFLRRVSATFPQSRRFFSSNGGHDFSSAIAELNKEMEFVFGEPPPSTLASSSNDQFMVQDSKVASPKTPESEIFLTHIGGKFMVQDSKVASPKTPESEIFLTHIGGKGEAQMVDVSPKESSKRVAVASCKVIIGKKVFDLVSANQMAKGDVLSVARIAGIGGAKQTSNLIPLCHNISLNHVRVDLSLNPRDHSVDIEGEAASTGKTGVEMEAMTAVTIAGLTVYDMCKAASKDIQITDVRLERKTGGKSGEWSRDS